MSCGAVVEFRPRAAACKVNSLSEALVDSLQPAPVKLLMWTGDEQKRRFLRWMRRHEAHLQSSFPPTATLGHSVPSYTGVLVPWHKSSLRDVGCVSEMQGVRCAQRGRPTTGFPPSSFSSSSTDCRQRVYSVSFIIYCSLSFAFSFLSFCLLSPSLLRQSVPSSLISALFGGALLESCNLQCRAFVNKLWAGHSPGSCENITLLQFKYMFFKEYLSWASIWFTKFDSWASAVYIPALGLCVSLL